MALSAQDEKDFSECFEMFDEQGEGIVPVKELSKMMTLLGWDPTKAELDEVVRKSGLRGEANATKSMCVTLFTNLDDQCSLSV